MGKSNDQRLIYFLFKELIPFTKKNTKILIINEQKCKKKLKHVRKVVSIIK